MNDFFVLNNRGDTIIFHHCRSGLGKSTNAQQISSQFFDLVNKSSFTQSTNINNNQNNNNNNNSNQNQLINDNNSKSKNFLFLEEPIIFNHLVEKEKERKEEFDCWFVYERLGNLFYALRVDSKSRLNLSECLDFLRELLKRFKQKFGELNEESVRRNFGLIYEILEESLEGGYPQSTRHISDLLLNQPILTHSHPNFRFHSNQLSQFIVSISLFAFLIFDYSLFISF